MLGLPLPSRPGWHQSWQALSRTWQESQLQRFYGLWDATRWGCLRQMPCWAERACPDRPWPSCGLVPIPRLHSWRITCSGFRRLLRHCSELPGRLNAAPPCRSVWSHLPVSKIASTDRACSSVDPLSAMTIRVFVQSICAQCVVCSTVQPQNLSNIAEHDPRTVAERRPWLGRIIIPGPNNAVRVDEYSHLQHACSDRSVYSTSYPERVNLRA